MPPLFLFWVHLKMVKKEEKVSQCRKTVHESAIHPAPPIIKNILGTLKVRCLFASQGCAEVVQRDKLGNHEATCNFSPVKCSHTGCTDTVPRRDLEKHEKECPNRLVSCSHDCGLQVKFVELRSHNCFREKRATMEGTYRKLHHGPFHQT